ncbi:DivIVA domain-containing protein [Agromyces italicus]|uniref:DivIVA domain-containing protein n=1 Tax=Agromyces italicus TaxID=279572 RepID=UPI000402AA3A|nr:hypothetical protein [Agromyces italicus]
MTPDLENEPQSNSVHGPTTAPIPIPTPTVTQQSDLATAVAGLPKTDPARFAVRHIGAGYDRAEVDAFLVGLNEAIDAVRSAAEQDRRERDQLRAELARLSATAEAKLDEDVTLGAVGLLSQAQTIADRAVADAEQYARDLVLAAREEYRDVLERAARAEDSHVAAGSTGAGPVASPQAAMPEIEYVRTYARVAQVQLRSVLEALAEQVDRLGALPQSADEPVAPPVVADDDATDEEPDWLPAVPPEPTVQRQTYIRP